MSLSTSRHLQWPGVGKIFRHFPSCRTIKFIWPVTGCVSTVAWEPGRLYKSDGWLGQLCRGATTFDSNKVLVESLVWVLKYFTWNKIPNLFIYFFIWSSVRLHSPVEATGFQFCLKPHVVLWEEMGQKKCENTILYTYKMKWHEMTYKWLTRTP